METDVLVSIDWVVRGIRRMRERGGIVSGCRMGRQGGSIIGVCKCKIAPGALPERDGNIFFKSNIDGNGIGKPALVNCDRRTDGRLDSRRLGITCNRTVEGGNDSQTTAPASGRQDAEISAGPAITAGQYPIGASGCASEGDTGLTC